MRKLKEKNIVFENLEVKTFEPNCVYISNFVFGEGFEILVKTNEIVKKGQPILQKNGQNILSPIFGKVKSIKLENNVNNDLVYFIEIEKIHPNNNFFDTKICPDFNENEVNFNENEEWVFEKIELKNKENLIELCKKFGLCSKQNFTYKIVENMGENLVIDAFDEKLVLNNKILLEKSKDIIKKVVANLMQILGAKKVIFCCNKKLKSSVKNLCDGIKIQTKMVIKTKQPRCGLCFEDLINIHLANQGFGQTKNLVSVCGGAIKNPCIINACFGTKIADFISFCGGFKQNIDEIEDFKYMALVAFNDETMLKQKIKASKTAEDRQKLENMLKEKQQQAYDNIFSKIETYHKKYLECLSAVFLSKNRAKIPTKNFELPLNIGFQGLAFLSFNEFN